MKVVLASAPFTKFECCEPFWPEVGACWGVVPSSLVSSWGDVRHDGARRGRMRDGERA